MLNRTLATLPIIVSLLLIGCGKPVERAPWPGHLRNISGFSESEKARILSAIESLNEKAGKEILSENESDSNFSVEIQKVSAASWPQSRAGFATVKTTDCKIEISDALFTNNKSDFLYPVVWHEIGHCAGLDHSSEEGAIMAPTTSILASYPSNIITKFIDRMRESAGI